MTVTYGFYDSISSDRLYNAQQFGSIFDGIIEDGVYAGLGDKLMVSEDSPVSMDVIIGSGRAWFNHTWTLNDADLSKTIATADALLDRIDVVYLEINTDSGTRANSFNVLTGTPASTPVAPSLTQTSTVFQYPLAHVYVDAAVTSITQAKITNKVGSVDTPFVAGIIDYVTTNEILAQWEAEWEDWFNAIKDQLSTEAETNLQNQIWDLAGVASGAPPYADDMVSLAAHDHSGTHPQIPRSGIVDYAIGATQIDANAVTSSKIQSGAVTEAKIGTSAVTNTKIAASAVTDSKIAANAVTNAKIQDGAVDYYAIAANQIGATHLGNEIPAIVRRYGGSSTDWNTPGTSGYSVGNVRMQMGVFTATYLTQVRIIYSPAFSNDPLLFFTFWDANIDDYQISFQGGESFAEEFIFTHFTSGETATVHWLAIGPE